MIEYIHTQYEDVPESYELTVLTCIYTLTATGDHHSGEYEWYSNGGHQCGRCTETTDREDVREVQQEIERMLFKPWTPAELGVLCRQWIKLSSANNNIEYYKKWRHDYFASNELNYPC